MQIVKPSVEIIHSTKNFEKEIEKAGRVCYKSEDLMTPESNERFVNMIKNSGHLSVIEHVYASFKIVCSRSCAQQITRHRLFSYSMESQRYCNYSKDKFERTVVFVDSFENITSSQRRFWEKSCIQSERDYFLLIDVGMKPEDARSVLNNSCKTEIVMSGNARNWKHFIDMRLTNKAQYEIRFIADRIMLELNNISPNIFKR
jgi:thymidylate synthase (FAD)